MHIAEGWRRDSDSAGDFNARVGAAKETDYAHQAPLSPFDEEHCITPASERRALDQTIDIVDKRVLRMCCELDLRIFNGRVDGDIPAGHTFTASAGSTVDPHPSVMRNDAWGPSSVRVQ